jgi:hypothetical protein
MLCKLTNSVALLGERTIPTERPQLVSEVGANFLRIEVVPFYLRRLNSLLSTTFTVLASVVYWPEFHGYRFRDPGSISDATTFSEK